MSQTYRFSHKGIVEKSKNRTDLYRYRRALKGLKNNSLWNGRGSRRCLEPVFGLWGVGRQILCGSREK